MFRWAKQANPHAVLYVNDHHILTGTDGWANMYQRQIREFLEQDVPIDGIGCQGHFDSRLDPNHVHRTLDQLAQFGLPIKITEYDFRTTDEQAKAQQLDMFFRICFAHPAVEAIYLWGFWEGAQWRPDAALWKQDWSPTPAAEVYRDLVFRQWWTRFRGRADAQGVCRVSVFQGTHLVRINGGTPQPLELPLGTREHFLRADVESSR
jgi:GH35 family endo-1,4-beta-xylanase